MAKRKKSSAKDDVTLLKHAYDGRFDDVSAAVFVVRPPDGRIVSVNVEAEELTGYERGELEAMSLADIFREEDRHRINSIFDASSSMEFRKLFEHNVIVRKRSRRKIMVDMGFKRTAADGPAGFVFTLQDITDLKTNEERVVRAHEYVNSIINSVLEIMIVTDAAGCVESVNAAAREQLGYDEGDLLGLPAAKLFPELPALAEPTTSFIETETVGVAKDGRRFPVVVSRSSLRSADADASAKAVLVATEISERKKAERLIAEQQMTIVQASKLSSLGEMASSIAHEINNPLQVVIGRCELLEAVLEETGGPKDVRDGIALIDRMSQRIHKITRGLQSLARDARNDAMEVVDVAEIVKETLALCEQRIKSRVPTFVVPEFRTPLPLRCHPTQISQVLLNLLNNSFDAVAGTPGAFIRLEVCRDGDEIEMTVTDSGRGIPTEVADRLFTPFYTTKPVGKGTGIGLSISRSLIESHGGRLALERGGANTRFVIRLPSTGPAAKTG